MPATTVTLVGNLTRQPELRYTTTGQATTSFGVAVNRRRQSKANVNEVTESVSFFTAVAWGALAENVCQSLDKGTRVVVQGRLEQRTWLDKDGERHTVYEVQVDEVGPSLRWANARVERVSRSAPAALAPGGDDSAGAFAGDETDAVGGDEAGDGVLSVFAADLVPA